MQYILYKSLYKVLGKLPWCLLEALSYIFSALLFSIIRYRRGVVRQNMERSFPKKSDLEIRALEWDFYQHIVFQFLSAPKMLTLPKDKIIGKHLHLSGCELLNDEVERGQRAIILLMGHCGNWELFAATDLALKPMGLQVEQLYRPLKNVAFDAVQKELRELNGGITTPKGDIGRRLIQHLNGTEGLPRIIAFIADQTPNRHHIGLWTMFLNQPTPWLDGAERLARKYSLPVYYLDIERINNRSYSGEFVRIASNGSETNKGDITKRFVEMLELSIMRDPAIWLWSHKRWKHKISEADIIE